MSTDFLQKAYEHSKVDLDGFLAALGKESDNQVQDYAMAVSQLYVQDGKVPPAKLIQLIPKEQRLQTAERLGQAADEIRKTMPSAPEKAATPSETQLVTQPAVPKKATPTLDELEAKISEFVKEGKPQITQKEASKDFRRVERVAEPQDVTKAETMEVPIVEVNNAWKVLENELGRDVTVGDIQQPSGAEIKVGGKAKNWAKINKATETLRKAYGLAPGMGVKEVRKEVVKQKAEELKPKGVRKSEGYETLKRQYQKDLMGLAQTRLDELSEDEWSALQEQWYGKSKEEITQIKQSLVDPSFGGHAREFSRQFMMAHPAAGIGKLLGVRPDVFQAAWDEVYTGLHQLAAVAGGLTGMAWSMGVIGGAAKQVAAAEMNPALETVRKGVASKKQLRLLSKAFDTPIDEMIQYNAANAKEVPLGSVQKIPFKFSPKAKGIGIYNGKWTEMYDPLSPTATRLGALEVSSPEQLLQQDINLMRKMGIKLSPKDIQLMRAKQVAGQTGGFGFEDDIISIGSGVNRRAIQAWNQEIASMQLKGVKNPLQKLPFDKFKAQWYKSEAGRAAMQKAENLLQPVSNLTKQQLAQRFYYAPKQQAFINAERTAFQKFLQPKAGIVKMVKPSEVLGQLQAHMDKISGGTVKIPQAIMQQVSISPQYANMFTGVLEPMIGSAKTAQELLYAITSADAFANSFVSGEFESLTHGSVLRQAVNFYKSPSFEPMLTPDAPERWQKALEVAKQGALDIDVIASDILLDRLQQTEFTNKAFLEDEIGKENLQALIKDGLVEEIDIPDEVINSEGRQGIVSVPGIQLTPTARERLASMPDAPLTPEENILLKREDEIQLASGGIILRGGADPLPAHAEKLTKAEKHRRLQGGFVALVDGYVAIEHVSEIAARTGFYFTASEHARANLKGPAVGYLLRTFDLDTYGEAMRHAFDDILYSHVVIDGRLNVKNLDPTRNKVRRKAALQWAKGVQAREKIVSKGLKAIEQAGEITIEQAQKLLPTGTFEVAVNNGWLSLPRQRTGIIKPTQKVIITEDGKFRADLNKKLVKGLRKVRSISKRGAWLESGKDIEGMIMVMEKAGGMAETFTKRFTWERDAATGKLIKTGPGLKPIIDKYMATPMANRLYLKKYLTGMTIFDRHAFDDAKLIKWQETRAGKKPVRTISPKLYRTAKNDIKKLENVMGDDFVTMQEAAKEIWAWWDRVLKAMKPAQGEYDRLSKIHKHYSPMLPPVKEAEATPVFDMGDPMAGLLDGEYALPQHKDSPLYDFTGTGSHMFLDPLEAAVNLMTPYAKFALSRDIQLTILDNIEKYPVWEQYFKEVTSKTSVGNKWRKISIWDTRGATKKLRYFKVAPDFDLAIRLVQGLEFKMPKGWMGKGLKVLGSITRSMQRAVTTFNPFFSAWNFIRDQGEASLKMRGGYLPFAGIVEGFSRYLVSAFKDLGKAIDYSELNFANLMEEWIAQGGSPTTRYHLTGKELFAEGSSIEIVKKLVESFGGITDIVSNPQDFGDFLQQQAMAAVKQPQGAGQDLKTLGKQGLQVLATPFRVFEMFSEISELVTRLSTYATARGRGLDPLVAHKEMIRAGLNFTRVRSSHPMTIMRQLIPFLGPHLLGWGTDFRKLFHPVEATGVWSRLLPWLIIGGACTVLAMTSKEYHNIPYRERMRYLHFPKFKRDAKTNKIIVTGLTRVPKPRNILGLGLNAMEATVNYAAYKDPEVFKAVIENFFGELFIDFTPFVSKIILQVRTERDFYYGQDIVPESRKDLEAAEQYTRYTSETFKLMGRGISNIQYGLTGEEAGSEAWWAKPAVLERMFLWMTGTAGQKIALPLGDLGLRTVGIAPSITRPSSFAAIDWPWNVRLKTGRSAQMQKALREDMKSLDAVRSNFAKRFTRETNYDFSWDEIPEEPSGDKVYFQQLWRVESASGESVPFEPGMTIDWDKGETIVIDMNALYSYNRQLPVYLRRHPELLNIQEYNQINYRSKQVKALIETQQAVIELSDKTLLGVDLQGIDEDSPPSEQIKLRKPEVLMFYVYMNEKHPEAPVSSFGEYDPLLIRHYVAEYKTFAEQLWGTQAAILAELGHYEYQFLFKDGQGLKAQEALNTIDASIAEYERRFGDFAEAYREVVQHQLGTTEEVVDPKTWGMKKLQVPSFGFPQQVIVTPETVERIEPQSGFDLLLDRVNQLHDQILKKEQ